MSKHERQDVGDIYTVKSEDNAMNEAINLAEKTFPQFKNAYNNRTTSIEYFSLKVPFEIPSGGNEHIWAEIVSKTDSGYIGIIQSVPEQNIGVTFGDSIEIYQAAITDWLYVENGKLTGGYTIRAIRDRLSLKEKLKFDEELGFEIE
jgi:uncharacterized protein YegJ (DUF2314 family)